MNKQYYVKLSCIIEFVILFIKYLFKYFNKIISYKSIWNTMKVLMIDLKDYQLKV